MSVLHLKLEKHVLKPDSPDPGALFFRIGKEAFLLPLTLNIREYTLIAIKWLSVHQVPWFNVLYSFWLVWKWLDKSGFTVLIDGKFLLEMNRNITDNTTQFLETLPKKFHALNGAGGGGGLRSIFTFLFF